MRNKYAVFLSVFAVLSFFGVGKANAATPYDIMVSIGALPGGTYSVANGVSADGSIVVGLSEPGYLDLSALSLGFKYTGSLPINSIGTFSVPSNVAGGSSALAVSGNGLVIVGNSIDGNARTRAVKYVGSTIYDLDPLGLSLGSATARAVSHDGSVIVGEYNNTKAFKYKDDSGIVPLGTLKADNSGSSWAYGVSANGLIIVGSSNTDSGYSHAFKYVEGGSMVDLHPLMGLGVGTSTALGISGDGTTIVGSYNVSSSPPPYDSGTRAFKYVGSTRTDLGNLKTDNSPGHSIANAVSADGSVIVGEAITNDGNSHAFKYVNGKMIDLGTLAGGSSSSALGVSADGSIVVGLAKFDDSHDHAFIFKSKAIVSIPNTSASLYHNSGQLNSIINARVFLMGNNLNQDCALFGSNNICVGIGGRYSGVTNNNTSEEAGVLKVAYKFNPHFRAGVMLDQVVNSDDPSNFTVSNPTPTVVVFTNLAQNFGGYKGYGVNFKLAASYNKSNLSIKRDAYLLNTEQGVGNTSLVSRGILAQLSYNHKIAKRLDIIPSFGIRYSNIVRNGYTESSSVDFPITYKALRQKSTTAIASVGLNLWKSPGFNFSLGGGVEHNLQSSIDGYAGTISQMGSFSLKSASITKTRPFAEAKVSYDFTNTQRVTSSIYYGKQQFNNAYATTVYLMYMMGF